MRKQAIAVIQCPSCKKTLEIYEHREVLTPAQKAEVKVTFTATISKQTKLPA